VTSSRRKSSNRRTSFLPGEHTDSEHFGENKAEEENQNDIEDLTALLNRMGSDIKMRQVVNQRLRLENQRLKAEMAKKMNEMVSTADSTRRRESELVKIRSERNMFKSALDKLRIENQDLIIENETKMKRFEAENKQMKDEKSATDHTLDVTLKRVDELHHQVEEFKTQLLTKDSSNTKLSFEFFHLVMQFINTL
jgi:chromosome segregation ATPase